MTSEDVLNEFRAAGALREGHFVLSSGLHSPTFLQKNLVFMDAERCARLCKALAGNGWPSGCAPKAPAWTCWASMHASAPAPVPR